jgi:hypothetical protein
MLSSHFIIFLPRSILQSLQFKEFGHSLFIVDIPYSEGPGFDKQFEGITNGFDSLTYSR